MEVPWKKPKFLENLVSRDNYGSFPFYLLLFCLIFIFLLFCLFVSELTQVWVKNTLPENLNQAGAIEPYRRFQNFHISISANENMSTQAHVFRFLFSLS